MVAVQAEEVTKMAVLLGSRLANAEGFSVHLTAPCSCEVLGGKSVKGCIAPMAVVPGATPTLKSRHRAEFLRLLERLKGNLAMLGN